MTIAGLTLLGIGSVGVLSAVLLELKYHEPIYKLLMKVFPWLLALGGVLVGIGGLK